MKLDHEAGLGVCDNGNVNLRQVSMITATSKACRLIGSRQLKPALAPSTGVRWYSQATQPCHRKLPQSFPELPRTQLFRYVLTGSTRTSRNDKLSTDLDGQLEELFAREKLPKKLGENAPNAQGGPTELRLRLKDGDVLSKIQSEIQIKVKDQNAGTKLVNSLPLLREALAQCESETQWDDLLATINGILARLQKLEVADTKELLLLGMRYAARCFSAPALRHYFSKYSEGGYGYLTPEAANELVKDLAHGLEMRTFDDPRMDKVISGINGHGSLSEMLRSLLDLSHPSECAFLEAYVKLLGQLGDQKRLTEIRPLIQTDMAHGRTTTYLTNAAVNCLEALVKSGNSQAAIEAARDLSRHCDLNVLLPVHVWVLLIQHDQEGLLRELPSDKAIQSMLTRELRAIELNLGVRWTDEERGSHIYSRETPIWCNNGNPEEAYQALGMDRLVPPTRHLLDLFGTTIPSKSISNLSGIAELLNEYEGVEIPLCSARDDHLGPLELAWVIQCSPIEITKNREITAEYVHNSSQLSSLGLLRVRLDCNGVPRKIGPHLHLMQLGYVVMRKKAACRKSRVPTPEEPERWAPTGHVVGWDRQKGRLVLLWVGKGYGVMNAGLVRPTAPSYLPHSCAEVGNSIEEKNSPETDVPGLGLVEIFKDIPGFWVDVDPGFDLKS
ncbi:hypothetical protein CPC735_040650 [Coccidioides posadasii C735 delta SOWgp]|uniref:Uncharacterized protein n=2 Tax=Coccidioides posadasii TaxID=199306 RepID=C5P3B3_COCP7|nr:hypothetical protein CPC735_040650 [Coccidioides posadasii C735 delta SOWgp]EER28801.1 hypothetical protein CPC735_040650 [Coccidioides posadasii C735 delta SOWgp]|eukprot:XP_003070946.1 hypothetical protein CPC735_040650 [Coccidioides posadasii C735 delta SOWgp]